MIEFTKAFKTTDGETHASLEDAKRHELVNIFLGQQLPESDQAQKAADDAAQTVLDAADKIVDILTTTASSKPRARKVNGGTKPRKAKTPPTPPTPTA